MWNTLKSHVTSALAASLLVVLFAVIFTQIILRAIGYPLVWAEEFSAVGFIWLVFMGAAVAYQRIEHLDVDLLHVALSKRLGAGRMQFWDGIVLVLQLVFLSVFGIGLVMMTRQTWSASMGALEGFRYGWIYLGVFVAIVICAGIVAVRLMHAIHRMIRGARS